MRVRRSILNFGTSVVYLVVTTCVSLVATPLLLQALGKAAFGAFPVVLTGYGLLSILEFGLGGALGPLFAQALTTDEHAVARTAAVGMRAYLKIAIVLSALGLALTPFVHLADAKITPAVIADLRVAWMIGLGAFLTLTLSPLRNLVEARQRGYILNILFTIQSIIITAVSIGLARAGWGITGQAIGHVTGVWLFNLLIVAVVARSHPGLLRAVVSGPVDPEIRAAMRGQSSPMMLFGICGRVGFMTDTLIVSRLLGFEAVTALVNTQKLAVMGQTVLQSIGNSSWAALADLHARGEHAVFNRRLIEMTRLVAILGAIGFVPVVAFNGAFFHLWLKNADYGGDGLVVVAVFNAVLLAEHSLWGWCFASAGKIGELVPLSIVATVLNLGASIVFTRQFGLVGPLLGTTFGFVSVGFWLLVWRLNRSFGTPIGALLRAVAWPLSVGAAASAGLWWSTRGHQPSSWLGLILAMIASASVMLAVSYTILLTRDDRLLWKHRLTLLPLFRPRTPIQVAP